MFCDRVAIISLVKKVLKLQDHKHTAKLVEHKHTSYRGLFLVMVVFGLCLMAVAKTANADDYVVNARVAAPIPTIAAQITSSSTQSVISSPNIVISGTCPIINPAIVVVLYNGTNMLGSAGCSVDGLFSGTFSLSSGTNVITPKVMTITNDFGPIGQPVTIIYQLPAEITPTTINPTIKSSTTPAKTPSDPQTITQELQIKTDAPIIAIKPNESFVWKINIIGGQSPYSILVDWGDGSKNSYTANSSGEQTLEHTFKKNKNTIIKVSVKDASGKEVFTTVAGVTFTQTVTPLVNGASQFVNSKQLPLTTYWLMYGLLLIVIMVFWRKTHSHAIVAAGKKKSHKNR